MIDAERTFGHASQERLGGAGDIVAQRIVRCVRAYVDAHYAEHISLRDVARELGYSAAHLTHTFRRQTGTAVTAAIIERRIGAAKELLLERSATVASVCERVGFNDRCYFTRQFVRLCGITPGRYRVVSLDAADVRAAQAAGSQPRRSR